MGQSESTRRGRIEEKRLAKREGGELVPASGAFGGEDYDRGEWRVQVKWTGGKTWRMDIEEVKQRARRAWAQGKKFVLHLSTRVGEFFIVAKEDWDWGGEGS